MKAIIRYSVLLAVALGLSAAACYGDLFDLSYTFDSSSIGSGTVVTGQFNGAATGNLINSISNLSLFFDGSSFGTIFYSENVEGTGPAVLSFNGTQNDFVFAGTAGDAFVSDTGPHTANGIVALDLATSSLALGAIDPRYWTVVDVTTHSVPDSGATLIMLGLGLVSLACVSRWKVQRSVTGR
jgi:hypothetical protein